MSLLPVCRGSRLGLLLVTRCSFNSNSIFHVSFSSLDNPKPFNTLVFVYVIAASWHLGYEEGLWCKMDRNNTWPCTENRTHRRQQRSFWRAHNTIACGNRFWFMWLVSRAFFFSFLWVWACNPDLHFWGVGSLWKRWEILHDCILTFGPLQSSLLYSQAFNRVRRIAQSVKSLPCK